MNDIKLMRSKLAVSRPARWDSKNERGGLLDCEFMIAFLSHFDTQSPWLSFAQDCRDILNQITILKAVFMPKENAADMPAALQHQIALLMSQDNFEAALPHLLDQMEKLARELDSLCARLDTPADK